MNAERLRLRAIAGLGLLVVAFGLLLTRLAFIQLRGHEHWSSSAVRQQWSGVQSMPADRGAILDRNGRELAHTEHLPSIAIDPLYARRRGETRALLAMIEAELGVDARERVHDAGPGRQFVWVARRLRDREAVARLRGRAADAGLRSLIVEYEPERVYPAGRLAAHVVGFTHRDRGGAEGMERITDGSLHGREGRRRTLRDGRRRRIVLAGQPLESPVPGDDVRLTLDALIQTFAEEAAETAFEKHRPESAVAAVVDVHTGEILGLACRPTYDPNLPGDADAAARRNRFFTDTYEPGSTFKPIVMAIALDLRAVAPGERLVECEDGRLQLRSRTIHEDRRKALGVLSPTGVIAHSSNVGMAVIGQRIGIPRLETAVRLWGFGSATGLDWPAEATGYVPPRRLWKADWTLCSVAFGHEMSVTSAQLLMAYAALANGGWLRPPRLLLDAPAPRARRVLRESSVRLVTPMLEEVLRLGTARHAAIPDYRVAGKTGTAQKLGPGNEGKHVASFACFGPAEEPRLAVLVVCDEPKGTQYGSVVAAPYATRLLRRSLRYLGVPPSAPPQLVILEPADGVLEVQAR